MNEKYEKMKKSLIASGVKAAIMIIGCGVGLAAAMYFYSNSEDEVRQLNAKDRQLKSQISKLRQRNERAENTLQMYDQLTKDSNLRSLELNRRNISNLLNRLGEKYRISDLSINISPLTEQTEEPFNKKTGTIITTQISIEFEALSDAHAFAFTEELLKSFSGYLNLRSYSVSRTGEVSEELLRKLLKDGKVSFIRGTLVFDWLGLRPNPPEKEEKS